SLSCRRQGDLTGRAKDERRLDRLFELLDSAAERGLRHVPVLGCTGKVELARKLQKVLEECDVHRCLQPASMHSWYERVSQIPSCAQVCFAELKRCLCVCSPDPLGQQVDKDPHLGGQMMAFRIDGGNVGSLEVVRQHDLKAAFADMVGNVPLGPQHDPVSAK